MRELTASQKEELTRDSIAYAKSNSRFALTMILSTVAFFALIFASRSPRLIAPGLIGMVLLVAWLSYKDRRHLVRCPECGAHVMRPAAGQRGLWTVTSFCSYCGVELTRTTASTRAISEEERNHYWTHNRTHFLPRPVMHYVVLGMSAIFLLVSFIPGYRGFLIFAGGCLLAVLTIRRYRKSCPACGDAIYDISAPYCSSCGTRLAPNNEGHSFTKEA